MPTSEAILIVKRHFVLASDLGDLPHLKTKRRDITMFITKLLKNFIYVVIWIIFVYLVLTYFGCVPTTSPTKYVPLTETPEERYPSLKNVDKVLESLELGSIAFNAPKEIQWNNTAVIELLLSPSFSVDELKDKIQEAGEREGAEIKIANQMGAVLKSSGFEIIELHDDKIQAISFEEITDWKWQITPIKRGEQTLYLTISAILFVNGERMRRKIETFKKEIYIKVTFIQKLGIFIEDKWDWLWGVVLIPLIIWVWKKWKSKKINKAI